MEFTITALDGDSVNVDADNWMTAMGKALLLFDVDIHAVGRMTCSSTKDGSILVEDGRRSWMVREQGADVRVRVTPKSTQGVWAPRVAAVAPEADLGALRPVVVMPESSLKRDEPRTLAEHLFELTTEVDQLTSAEACDRALDAILAFVRADGSCIARGTVDDAALECLSARGPRAERLLGRKIGFGEGLLGLAFDMCSTVSVGDVSADTPHVDLIDAPTLTVLCVPLLDDEGGASGVVQLVNPAHRAFTPANVELVELVARTLAAALAGR